MGTYIKDNYNVELNGDIIGSYYVYREGDVTWYPSDYAIEKHGDKMKELGLDKKKELKRPLKFFRELLTDKYRVPGLNRPIYVMGDLRAEREPHSTGERYMVYSLRAEKGEQGYSEKEHSVPHYEGPHTPEGMKEWCSWYCFNKMDDGTYEAELDEAWWWGGGHNDGGTINNDIPEEWFELPYDDFLERVITLSAAKHYLFTVEDLKECSGLKEFFGYK